jgi:tetratricopeptide (TPR) repeat protein/predicted Ser/Thr protein kinase
MTSSKTSPLACPGEALLHDYHARALPPVDVARLEAHFAACPACQARSAALVAEHETWVARLRAAGAPPPGPLPPAAGLGLRPESIPGYEILEEIGRGGQGLVYRAVQRSTKREVALKVLREGPYAAPAARRRFEREVELVAALRHPHIVTVFDSGATADGLLYFAMDYVHGRRLDRYLAAENPPRPARLALFGRICHAVNYAHQRTIIHRDLKPSNVLVGADGEPHILDFGLARHVAAAGPSTFTTTASQVAGTLPYLSPELARAMPDAAEVRSDVYALGVILYEMLTGRYPYPVTGDTLDVLRHIAETPPQALADRRPGASAGPTGITPVAVDAELETIVLKALAKERERRYQTAGELGRDLEHYLAGEPIEARRDSGLYVLRKTLQRYRIAVGVVVAFVVLVTVSAVSLGVMYGRQLRLREEAQRQAALARGAEAAAEQRFAQVRELARFFVQGFDPLIAQLPGSAPARQKIVEKGLAYLDGLAQGTTDPALQEELAGAYITIGDVQGDFNASSLGNLGGAVESYRKALELAEAGGVRHPEHTGLHNALLLGLNKLGDALRAQGHWQEAQPLYERVLTRGADWLRTHPDDPRTRSNVGNAHERLGTLLAAAGQLDAALAHFNEALRRVREDRAARPHDPWTARGLGVVLTKVAGIHYARREWSAALANYREFLEISEQLRAAHPENVVPRRDVGIAQQWLGIIQADQGARPEALAAFAASDAAFEDLLRDDPQDPVAQTQLVINASKVGEVHLAERRQGEAARWFTRTVDLVEPLARRFPDQPDILRLQGVAYYKLAELERAHAAEADETRPQHVAAACDWLRKCRAVFCDLRDRGLLPPADANTPAELDAELADCERGLVAPPPAAPTSAPVAP